MNDTYNIELISEGLERVPEAAKFLGLSKGQIYKLMSEGMLPCVRIGRSRRVPIRAVRELAIRNLVVAETKE